MISKKLEPRRQAVIVSIEQLDKIILEMVCEGAANDAKFNMPIVNYSSCSDTWIVE